VRSPAGYREAITFKGDTGPTATEKLRPGATYRFLGRRAGIGIAARHRAARRAGEARPGRRPRRRWREGTAQPGEVGDGRHREWQAGHAADAARSLYRTGHDGPAMAR
jgi:hypothetical protein